MSEITQTGGYLDVVDATLRAPRLEATSNIGISNTNPEHAFSVGSNLYVSTDSSNVITVDGSVVCEGVKVGLIEIVPSYDFAAVSNVGNVTQSTIQFANATTGFVTTSNIEVGTANLFVDTVNSKVGIGVTEPGATLEVTGNAFVSSNLEVGTANLFVDTVNSRVGIGTDGPVNTLHVYSTNNDQTSGLLIEKAQTGTGAAAIFFGVAGTSETNNKGIPKAAIFYERNLVNGRGDIKFCNDATDDTNPVSTVAADTRMIIKNDGNVGINTVSPASGLHVRNPGGTDVASSIIIQPASTQYGRGYAKIEAYPDATFGAGTGLKFYTRTDDGLNFDPASLVTARMTIKNDGRVGLGTTNPLAELHVQSDNKTFTDIHIQSNLPYNNSTWTRSKARIFFRGNGGFTNGDNQNNYGSYIKGGFRDGYNGGQNWANGFLSFHTRIEAGAGETEAMTITNDGKVGIQTNNPTYNLHVNGSLFYSSGGLNGSDDRIKYNEENVSNALSLISQLNPKKYEKIMEIPQSIEGTWIPTDEEWENVKENYKYGDEFGFVAQDVRNVPELSFLVNGEETRIDTKTISFEMYSNLTTEEQGTYTISYIHRGSNITQNEYYNLTSDEQEACITQYTKQTETQTPLALNYQGLFVVAIGAIKELKAKNEALEARVLALESA